MHRFFFKKSSLTYSSLLYNFIKLRMPIYAEGAKKMHTQCNNGEKKMLLKNTEVLLGRFPGQPKQASN